MSTWRDDEGRWHAEACIPPRRRLHRRLPAGASQGDAKRLEADLVRALHTTQRQAVQAGQTHQSQIPGDPPLSELLADYAERHTKTLRSPKTARYHALRIGRWCEGKRASDTRAVVAKIKADMHGHYAPATINRSLGALRKALGIAWETGTATADYSGLVKALPEHNAGTTWLNLQQVQQLTEHCSAAVRAAVWISVLTGCRRGEVLSITPAMISADTITLPTGGTKTMKARSVPIIAPLRPWLAQVPIGITFEGLKSGFRRARVAAGMPHVQFRDLRRSCGTLLIQSGVPLHVVSRILGHSSTGVTERVYAHLAQQQLHDGMDALTALHAKMER